MKKGGNIMYLKENTIAGVRKLKILIVSLAVPIAMLVAIPAMAGVHLNIGIGLPPPIVVAPPDVVLLPGAPGVYVAPDIGVDLYFWNGWWWRPWEGHWYRSHHYDRGWRYYDRGVPRFYHRVNPEWRGYYRSHRWDGRPWDYRRIPNREFEHHRYGRR